MYLAQRNVALKLNEVNFFNIFSYEKERFEFNQLLMSSSTESRVEFGGVANGI